MITSLDSFPFCYNCSFNHLPKSTILFTKRKVFITQKIISVISAKVNLSRFYSLPNSLDLLTKTPLLKSLQDVLPRTQFQSLLVQDSPPHSVIGLIEAVERENDILSETEQSLQELNEVNHHHFVQAAHTRLQAYLQTP